MADKTIVIKFKIGLVVAIGMVFGVVWTSLVTAAFLSDLESTSNLLGALVSIAVLGALIWASYVFRKRKLTLEADRIGWYNAFHKTKWIELDDVVWVYTGRNKIHAPIQAMGPQAAGLKVASLPQVTIVYKTEAEPGFTTSFNFLRAEQAKHFKQLQTTHGKLNLLPLYMNFIRPEDQQVLLDYLKRKGKLT